MIAKNIDSVVLKNRMTRLSLEALKILDAIDRRGSFALAAEEMCRVPSTITYTISTLESQLGIEIFSRQGHKAKLTPLGKLLLKEGRKLLLDAAHIENKLKMLNTGWEDQINIAYDQIIPFKNLAFLIEDFYKECPHVELKIRGEVLNGCWDSLFSRKVDLTIGVTGEPSLHEEVLMLPLGEIEFVLVVSPNHSLANKSDFIDMEELRQFRIIAVSDSALGSTRSSAILSGQNVLTVSTFSEKIEALLHTLGIGFLPLPIAQPFISNGTLILKKVKKTPKGILSSAWRTRSNGKALQWFINKLSDATICKKIITGN